MRYERGASRPEAEQRNEVAALLERGTSALEIVFQPVVELATGRAGGYEALTRIDTEPRRGPDEWFAQAHRVGLGDELEALALRAALEVPAAPTAPSSRSTSRRARCSPRRSRARSRRT